MTEITLREYQPGDWRAMHALDLVCFTPPFRFSRQAMRRFAETPGAINLLAEFCDQLGGRSGDQHQAQLAGFCIAHLEASSPQAHQPGIRTAYLVTLDVAPAFRRQGLARHLMHQLEIRAQAASTRSMTLHVFPGNTAAVKLYEALGYQYSGTAVDFYGPGLDALVYSKEW